MNSKLMNTLTVTCMAALLMAGCASMGGGSGADMLASGNHSNMKDPEFKDVHNQAELDAMWKKAFANLSGAPDKPVVDFSKNMLIFAFAGSQSTGGYLIRVKKVDASGPEIQVTVVLTQPGRDCHHPQGASEPFMFATIPASSKPVNFDSKWRKAPDCG